jgi:hypothetical protein
VRCGFSSTMGTSKQGDRRRRGVEKWALEIFRVKKVDEVDLRSSISAADALPADEAKLVWNGTVATIDVSATRSLDTESGIVKIATHPLALHAIDSTPYILLDSGGDPLPHLENTCLMAYGGASGLLRIHTIDILREIMGSDS